MLRTSTREYCDRPRPPRVRPVAGPLIAAVALQALASTAQVAGVACLAFLAGDVVAGTGDVPLLPTIVWAGALLLGASLLSGVATTISHLADNSLALVLRRRMAARLARVRLGWFTGRGAARVKQVVQDDIATMHQLVAHALLDVTAVLVVPVASLTVLLVSQPVLAIAVLLVAIASFLLFRRAMAGSGPRMAAYGAAVGALGAAAVEAVEGVDAVRAVARHSSRAPRLVIAAESFNETFVDWIRSTRLSTALAFTLASPIAALVVVTIVGTGLLLGGLAQPAALVPALVLGPLVSAPIGSIGTRLQSLRRGLAAARSVDELCATAVLPVVSESCPPEGTDLVAEHLRFAYSPGTDAVDDVSFRLEPGTTTALVGASGAGKSTLAALLARFEDPDSGRILLGGVDLRDLSSDDLYRSVGFVFQDVVLVRDTIRETIRMGREDVDDEAVERAVREVGMHERIMALPRGYETPLGDGVEFSGGEAQRLAISRALVSDAPVMVLDEATAHADAESELHIRRALARLFRGRTVLVIAHRLSTARDADQVLLMSEGRIVQRGTHGELIRQEDGPYLRLWEANDRGSES